MLLTHAAQQLGQLELQLRAVCVKWGIVGRGLKVSMYDVLMNQYLGDVENIKAYAKYLTI